MTNYYKEKREALKTIDQMILEGKKENSIVFTITTKYGFGEKIVRDRIKLIESLR